MNRSGQTIQKKLLLMLKKKTYLIVIDGGCLSLEILQSEEDAS